MPALAYPPRLPAWLHLEFVIPLYLVGEIVPKLSSPAARTTVVTAAVVALVALAAPLHLGVAIAVVAGLTAGRFRTTAEEAGR
jgi:predicted branched-subunit amino acid permease